MRTFFRALIGFVLAMLAAAVTQVMFAFPPMAAGDVPGWAMQAGVWALAAATHIAIFSFLFAFVAIAIAEWLGWRAWTYYVLTGIAIALGGFLAQYAAENASQPTIFNNYALTAFITAGGIGGLVYWLVAGRGAGSSRGSGAKITIGDDEDPAGRDTGFGPKGSVADTGSGEPQKPMTSVPTTKPLGSNSPLRVARAAAPRTAKPA